MSNSNPGIPNVHPQTGIAYGVIQGNNVPELLEDVFTNGDDLSFAEWKEDTKKTLQSAIESAIDSCCCNASVRAGWLDYDELLDSLDLAETYECEEPTYSYEFDGVKLQLSWLGGAPLLWIIESPYVTYARQCSPCVPNGGDLDSPDAHGMRCYCLPPDDMPTEGEAYVIESANTEGGAR